MIKNTPSTKISSQFTSFNFKENYLKITKKTLTIRFLFSITDPTRPLIHLPKKISTSIHAQHNTAYLALC